MELFEWRMGLQLLADLVLALTLPFIKIPAGEHESDERNSEKFGANASARQTVQ